MVLVDTSVWIDHLRRGDATLAGLLERTEVLMHPFIIGEIACGALRRRQQVLALLGRLPAAPVASPRETLAFIERHALSGRGIGYVDVHLLAATALARDARLWTRDRRLRERAEALGVGMGAH